MNKSKFKFEISILRNNSNSNSVSYISQKVFADLYEIEQGSITFFQSTKTGEKVPVLSYPPGKWEALALVDDNNFYPALSQYMQPGNSVAKTDESESDSANSNNSRMSFSNSGRASIPGTDNSQEYKKEKNEWLEKNIKEYTKTVEIFNLSEFIHALQKDSLFRRFKPTETDIIWSISSLIKDRMVATRKFSDADIQKTLNLNLNEIMKRHWTGKMAPILEVLNEKEDTKNANAIDLAVWMVKNNFN